MLSAALSGLVLICNFFEETYFCHLHAYLLVCFYEKTLNVLHLTSIFQNLCHLHAYLPVCFYEKHLKCLTSHIYFHLDDSELWKPYQSVSQEMMEQLCDLETVQPQEIPVKVCVVVYNIAMCYRDCGGKTFLLQSFNILECIVVGLSMEEGLFSLFYCESCINHYAVPKTLADVFGASLLLLELGCLRLVVLPYHLRMFLRVLLENNIFLVK